MSCDSEKSPRLPGPGSCGVERKKSDRTSQPPPEFRGESKREASGRAGVTVASSHSLTMTERKSVRNLGT